MSEEIITGDLPSAQGPDKPVSETPSFPPLPEPTDDDFDEDVTEEEKEYFKNKFPDLNMLKTMRLHCTACDRHLGSAAKNETRMRSHPMLRTLVCHTCHTFYNSGEFDKGDDGSELYCRWCGQGGQVYCCSDCPHVFCAKCIRRNFGQTKIKEIENTDDWKCFKCNPKCLWDMRALCWGLLRFCDLRNKITYQTEDRALKEAYQRECATDFSECCKNKIRRSKDKKKDTETAYKKKEDSPLHIPQKASVAKKSTCQANVMTKLASTIQVKKFASINLDESPPKEKKAQKRPASPKVYMPPPAMTKILPKMLMTPPQPIKKPRMQIPLPVINPSPNPPMTPVRFHKSPRYSRPRILNPLNVQHPAPLLYNSMNNVINNSVNGFNSGGFGTMTFGDNINLSLESLTQGLDMASVMSEVQSNMRVDDTLVCTPDLPLEPLCEVTEDNTDDDVQCISPKPTAPKPVPRTSNPPNISLDNIIQMTENDVTVNAATGGLKFRVDPQTLSSNKMYRLPDGRVFAINANPNMPGGYSATIVAVTEAKTGSVVPKGATYAAKLSAVPCPSRSSNSPSLRRGARSENNERVQKNKNSRKSKQRVSNSARQCDMQVPVEWFRFSLIDATDCLEYSLSKLQKLKKDATTAYLRTRNMEEMRYLHGTVERLMNTSISRFKEIKETLNMEMKRYVAKKSGSRQDITDDDDDDDVEILNDAEHNEPIFIDENSMESNTENETVNETQEVDLTETAGSEHNDSAEKSLNQNNTLLNDSVTDSMQTENSLNVSSKNNFGDDSAAIKEMHSKDESTAKNNIPNDEEGSIVSENEDLTKINGDTNDSETSEQKTDNVEKGLDKNVVEINKENSPNKEEKTKDTDVSDGVKDSVKNVEANDDKIQEDVENNIDGNDDKTPEVDMNDELIESLLKGDDIDPQSLNLDFQDS